MLANLSEKVGRGISSGPKSWALPRACFFFFAGYNESSKKSILDLIAIQHFQLDS